METTQPNRTIFLIEGILFIILGLFAVALPAFFTLSIELFLGWLLLIGGIIQMYRTFTSTHTDSFYPFLIGSAASIVAGILLLAYPLTGIITLTLLLAVYFLVEGIAKMIVAMQWKPTTNWGWLFLSGVISVILAGLILSGFPGTAVWVIGLLVGINMLFFGWSLIALSLVQR
ncbi:MAG: HdeD family acid-resistance protein [Parachlamydiaceae bacterium]|nr:HdeD family acid-resistance protein [Parachlamydiaceae bacterium]